MGQFGEILGSDLFAMQTPPSPSASGPVQKLLGCCSRAGEAEAEAQGVHYWARCLVQKICKNLHCLMGFGLYNISAEILNIMGGWLQSNFITQFIHLTPVLEDKVLVIRDIFSVDAQRTLRLPVWLT